MRRSLVTALALLLTGCASSSVLDLQSDMVQISTSAAPVCGASGAQGVAARRAAIETINRGYDKYIVVDGSASNDVRVVGHSPIYANTYGSGSVTAYGNSATYNGTSTTTYSGGIPIVAGHHNQNLIVKMFKNGDAGSDRAVDARRVLGPEWKKEIIKIPNGTC